MACNLTILCHGWDSLSSKVEVKRDAVLCNVRSKVLIDAKCNIFPLLYLGYQSILCPDRKCLTYLCVESSQHTHSPRTPCPCCSRTKKGDFRPPQPRSTLGRGQGAWGNSTPYRKYWLQYMWITLVTLEDKMDCGGLGVVITCCCRDNLKMLINDKKVINQRTAGPPF